MIKSFSDTETEKIFFRDFSRKLPPDIQRNARRKLELLNVAKVLNDLRIPPGNRLEKLVGDRVFALFGEKVMLTMLKSSITTGSKI